jgi:hypothetical protein
MKDQKVIRINILGRGGSHKMEFLGKKALKKIKEVACNERWIYIDHKFVAPEVLTQATIEKAEDITITNSLYGG